MASNPNRGKLAAQLEASKAAPRAPEPRQEGQLVVSACFLYSFVLIRSHDDSDIVGLISLVAESQSLSGAFVRASSRAT